MIFAVLKMLHPWGEALQQEQGPAPVNAMHCANLVANLAWHMLRSLREAWQKASSLWVRTARHIEQVV
jgi:hypothetical protein